MAAALEPMMTRALGPSFSAKAPPTVQPSTSTPGGNGADSSAGKALAGNDDKVPIPKILRLNAEVQHTANFGTKKARSCKSLETDIVDSCTKAKFCTAIDSFLMRWDKK